jgi:hypothetical protein
MASDVGRFWPDGSQWMGTIMYHPEKAAVE